MNKTEGMRKVRDDVVALTGELADHRRQEGNHAVLGEGSHDASIMFVGEAPGKNEAQTGKPFCGASGKLLDSLLESIDTPREDVYITNIVKDRPPNNRDPLPNEIELYAPFLDRQIEIIQPKVIATLGRFAMGYVMKKFDLSFEIEPISTAHGKVYDAEAGFGKFKIAPMYHPAAAIYNQSLKDTLKKDFQVLVNL
jgi:uracil-DNA glycosylase